MNEVEDWKPVVDYQGLYDISNQGRIRSYYNNRSGFRKQPILMKPSVAKNGYYVVGLRKDGKQKTCYIHKLVAEAFIGKVEKTMVIDHRNTIKTDNRVENLRIVTPRENANNPITKLNMAKGAKGKVLSEEHKRNISISVRKAKGL